MQNNDNLHLFLSSESWSEVDLRCPPLMILLACFGGTEESWSFCLLACLSFPYSWIARDLSCRSLMYIHLCMYRILWSFGAVSCEGWMSTWWVNSATKPHGLICVLSDTKRSKTCQSRSPCSTKMQNGTHELWDASSNQATVGLQSCD